jgi:hypothetical protein
MPPGPSVRVLLFHPDRPATRPAIDWIVERQRHARVIVPPSLWLPDLLPARALHEPFVPADPDAALHATELSASLSAHRGGAGIVAEATILALLEGGAVIAADTRMFRDLISLSSWSMNLPERPTDGLLVQHLGIAGRMREAWSDAAAEALDAILSADAPRLARAARARRLRARRDGPDRFGRLAKKSAGLRPAVVYLDLLASPGAAAAAFADRLRLLDRTRALSLLSVAAAVFI